MFRHRENRTLVHNLTLASLLALVAGIVNISGVMSVQHLTTNLTGHFAFFSKAILENKFDTAILLFLFIFSYFFGAFFSSFLMEARAKRDIRFMGTIPVIVECLLLIFIAIAFKSILADKPYLVACLLLFSMGMQNALVTNISHSIVRTTHLTGLFTDLGIEFSQLFFYREKSQQKRLRSSIKLHFSIIFFFFLGIILGGYVFANFGFKSLLLAAIILMLGMVFEVLKTKILKVFTALSSDKSTSQ